MYMEADGRNFGEEAKKVIESIPHMTLATITKDGRPWNTPVYFIHDEDYNFYWYSDMRSQHSKNIEANGKAFVVIYDSHPETEDTVGVYMEGKARALLDKDLLELERIMDIYSTRAKIARLEMAAFSEESNTRFFRFVPTSIWANSGKRVASRWLDIRIEITGEFLK
jgi:pyridoxine/pyridoxamine 5'-phosphate oxidase